MEISVSTAFLNAFISESPSEESQNLLDHEPLQHANVRNTEVFIKENRVTFFAKKTHQVFRTLTLFSPPKVSVFSLSKGLQSLPKTFKTISPSNISLNQLLKKVEPLQRYFFPQSKSQSEVKNLSTYMQHCPGMMPKANSLSTSSSRPQSKTPQNLRAKEDRTFFSSSEKTREEEKLKEEKKVEREGKNEDTDSQSGKDHSNSYQVEEVQKKEKRHLENGKITYKKPLLSPPRMSVFTLYHVLNKEGIKLDANSTMATKQEIEYIDELTTQTHKKRIEELKKALEKEVSANRWSVAVKVASWLSTSIGIISGAALIASGTGLLAGAILLGAGILSLSNQLLNELGGWKKIAEKLPCDDPEKKRAIIQWAQIGIAVLCLALSAVAIYAGGFANVKDAYGKAQMLAGAFVNVGGGVCKIGEGFNTFMYYDKLGNVKKHEMKLAELKHHRQNLMQNMESGIDRLKNLYENLSSLLGFYDEMFYAEQRIYR